MRRRYEYDMAVLGGGAAGLAAAIMSANLGAKTALIEMNRLGGECTFTGCIPSKTLLYVARMFHEAERMKAFGSFTEVIPKFGAVMDHVRQVRERIYQSDDAPPNLERQGIDVLQALGRFTGPDEIEVTSKLGESLTLRFRFAIIATGSQPRTLRTSLPGLTNETLFDLAELPADLVIAGAGPVGIEMAQAFARLGSRVTVVAPESRILPKDDNECAQIVSDALQQEHVQFVLGRSIRDYRMNGGRAVAVLDDEREIQADALLLAIGRRPRTDDLGLNAAGVELRDGNIAYDAHCRTTAKHIFVSGDVAGWYRFTHAAEHMSRVAVTNALLRLPAKLDEAHIAWTTFTQPELAHAGATEERLRNRQVSYTVHRMPYERLDRAVTDGRTNGLIKALTGRRGRILGVTIAGARAGDLIGEWALAMRKHLTLKDISETIHCYPTYALGTKRVADEWYAGKARRRLKPLLRLFFGYGR